jgi:hypothetical protein
MRDNYKKNTEDVKSRSGKVPQFKTLICDVIKYMKLELRATI